MTKRYFGTDGIRGKVGEAPITPDFMLKLGWACGRVFTRDSGDREERCTVVIGKDTRGSGYRFESALEAGLVAAGVDVKLLGPMPTPGIALMTRTQRAVDIARRSRQREQRRRMIRETGRLDIVDRQTRIE